MTINKIKLNGITQDLALSIGSIGATVDQFSESMNQLAELMKSMECVNARIDYIEDRLSQLGPAPDAKTENPKQKSDLEIFSQIEPSSEFLKLEDNIFLN